MSNEIATRTASPLGATVSRDGVNFAVYSKNAAKLELLFFDSVDAAMPSRVISLEPLQFKLPPAPSECQGPWRRWIDTALESPHDACEWRCGRPVNADQYRV